MSDVIDEEYRDRLRERFFSSETPIFDMFVDLFKRVEELEQREAARA